jgi:cytochrome c biogenesis protein CcdA
MDSSIFFGGSAIAAFIAGVIALFAPCCISVMLPAYFASSFQNRPVLVAMTFLFAAGVATVILPLVMGASLLRQLFITQHTVIFVAGGLLMLTMATFALLGGKLQLPMPSGRAAVGKAGPLGIYSLGIFSGVASSCCAPVLAGVIALSSVAPSFALALGLGTAYVFGMVAPLFVISLLWERYDWRSSRLFRPRSITWRLGGLRRTISISALATGVLLALMGMATIWVGLAYDAMPASGDWSARVSVRLQHYGQAVTDALSTLPGWLTAAALIAIAALLARRAFRQTAADQPRQQSQPAQRAVCNQGDHCETSEKPLRSSN